MCGHFKHWMDSYGNHCRYQCLTGEERRAHGTGHYKRIQRPFTHWQPIQAQYIWLGKCAICGTGTVIPCDTDHQLGTHVVHDCVRHVPRSRCAHYTDHIISWRRLYSCNKIDRISAILMPQYFTSSRILSQVLYRVVKKNFPTKKTLGTRLVWSIQIHAMCWNWQGISFIHC
jgi:hypothetical protein